MLGLQEMTGVFLLVGLVVLGLSIGLKDAGAMVRMAMGMSAVVLFMLAGLGFLASRPPHESQIEIEMQLQALDGLRAQINSLTPDERKKLSGINLLEKKLRREHKRARKVPLRDLLAQRQSEAQASK